MSGHDILIGLSFVLALVFGIGIGWRSRGNVDERRTTSPTVTLFERPTSKRDDSRI